MDRAPGAARAVGRFRVCFVGSVVFHQPLDPTNAKKYRALRDLGDVFVVGFATTRTGARFTEDARFNLLPSPSSPLLRYLVLYTLGVVTILGRVVRDGVTVLVAQGPHEGFAAAVAKVVARALGRKTCLLVESHGDFERDLFLQRRLRLERLYRFAIRRVSAFTLRRADALRAVSTSTREQLESWAPAKPVLTFPAWTDIDAFAEAGARESTDPNVLLYAGAIIPRKGVDRLVEAFRRVSSQSREARLVIVGSAEDAGYESELKASVAEHGLDAKVTFRSPLAQAELAAEMARAGALVLPSLSEGLGRVVFEAMAAGTLVIGSRTGGIVDMIEDGVTGFLVTPGNVDELAERALWVVSHPDDARSMGARARRFAETFFSTDRYVSEYRHALTVTIEACGSSASR